MITILTNISSLVTVRSNGATSRVGTLMQDVGEIRNGAVVHNGSEILWVGQASELPPAYLDGATVIDCTGRTVMPGFVDSHTHMVFAGSRSHEFARRLAGASYAEIAAEGGGILTTMIAVRHASVDELAAFSTMLARRLQSYTAARMVLTAAKAEHRSWLSALAVEMSLDTQIRDQVDALLFGTTPGKKQKVHFG